MVYCNECRRSVADGYSVVIGKPIKGPPRKVCVDCATKIMEYRKKAKKRFDELMRKS